VSGAEQRLRSLGLSLPSGSAPAANYANAVRTGNLLFIAGKAPLPEDGKLPKGRLGREFTTEQGYKFARSDHARVLNGCSDLLVEVFGERGVHARSVIGASSLRGGLPVILKAVVEVT